MATRMPSVPPAAACSENARLTISDSTSGRRAALKPITINPPTRYNPTLKGDSFSATRPIDLMPPMITSHVSTAMTIPETIRGIPIAEFSTSAIEFGWVNGVVVSAATAATSAKIQASAGERSPSRR